MEKLNLDVKFNNYYQNICKNTYSIVCVKKNMLEKKYESNYSGALIGSKKYWSDHQLFIDPSDINNHFINDIDLQNLDFNIDADEDLVFINNIEFYPQAHYYQWSNNAKLNQQRIRIGLALVEHSEVEVVLKYKNSYF